VERKCGPEIGNKFPKGKIDGQGDQYPTLYRAKPAVEQEIRTIQGRGGFYAARAVFLTLQYIVAVSDFLTLQPTRALENNSAPITAYGSFSGLFKRRWVTHTVFWLLYYLFYTLIVVFGIYQVNDLTFYFQLILFFPLDIALVYLNFYVLIPHLLKAGKYLYYGLSLVVALLASASLNLLVKEMYAHFGSRIFAMTSAFNFINLTGAMLERVYLLGLTTAIKLSKDWIQSQQLLKEREMQYLATELNFLKSQIQPHFFFNTLNNLYSLTLKKSDQAPEIVLKLSDLMSYMLYESNTPKVSLQKEIAYLQNYLDLEKLRFGGRLTVSLEIEGPIERVIVPPMLLILFIENSFKHGLKDNIHKINIDIVLRAEREFLFFSIKNPVSPDRGPMGPPGIGLKNAKRRLEILYGGNYSLDIVEKDMEYTVSLKIPLC
jgi:two-component system, LytTR family, sensor kinase